MFKFEFRDLSVLFASLFSFWTVIVCIWEKVFEWRPKFIKPCYLVTFFKVVSKSDFIFYLIVLIFLLLDWKMSKFEFICLWETIDLFLFESSLFKPDLLAVRFDMKSWYSPTSAGYLIFSLSFSIFDSMVWYFDSDWLLIKFRLVWALIWDICL